MPWISSAVHDWFHISKETVDALREELAATRAERDALKVQVATAQVTGDWLRNKVNQLELERAGLIEAAYQIKLPAVPQIQRQRLPTVSPNEFSFSDVGDELARKLGLPVWTAPDTTED